MLFFYSHMKNLHGFVSCFFYACMKNPLNLFGLKMHLPPWTWAKNFSKGVGEFSILSRTSWTYHEHLEAFYCLQHISKPSVSSERSHLVNSSCQSLKAWQRLTEQDVSEEKSTTSCTEQSQNRSESQSPQSGRWSSGSISPTPIQCSNCLHCKSFLLIAGSDCF